MAEIVTLKAEPRAGSGSRTAAKIRRQGFVPGIVYGHKEANVPVSVNAEALDRAIRVLHARVLALELDGKKETVLIRELQWDHLGRNMLHVDFARVSETETVRVTVPVELRNMPKAAGGAVLDQPLHTLHVECSPVRIPDAIRIDLTTLALGSPVHVRDVTFPEGVKALDPPEAVIVQLKLPGVEPTAPAVPAEPGAGPEVIKKEKKEEEEEE